MYSSNRDGIIHSRCYNGDRQGHLYNSQLQLGFTSICIWVYRHSTTLVIDRLVKVHLMHLPVWDLTLVSLILSPISHRLRGGTAKCTQNRNWCSQHKSHVLDIPTTKSVTTIVTTNHWVVMRVHRYGRDRFVTSPVIYKLVWTIIQSV